MPHPRVADLHGILATLLEAHVEFIVIGGAAAILHGSPTTTQDLDVVHRRTDENIDRLLGALSTLDATIREVGNRGLRPDRDLLLHGRQPLLSTALGDLDTLCVLNDGRGYEELLSHSIEMHVDERPLRVLDLDTLIEVKAVANRPKDRLVLPILLALRDQRK